MDIRTFEAFSMKDAVKSVKKVLGVDAVILSTKEKPAPGGKGTLYEVTAAAAGSTRKTGASRGEASHGTGIGGEQDTRLDATLARLTTLSDQSPTKRQVAALESGMQELKLLLVETLRGKDGSTLQDLPEAIVPIDRQLRVMGVSDVAIAELVKHLRTIPPPERGSDDASGYYRDQAVRWMMKRIKIASRWTVMPGSVSYHALVGATGVGKSAFVAKLAALYSMREKHKVAVVSLDNQRLAAAEQMRVFCKIIGVPFLTAQNAQDVQNVTSIHRDVELVLIDTAGTSPKNADAISELESLKLAGIPCEYHLCLSVTEKETQMEQAIRSFSRLGLNSLIFTKLDESWSFGEIYNLSKKWTLPLSFFGIGGDVPDDLERATRERVIERIFGL